MRFSKPRNFTIVLLFAMLSLAGAAQLSTGHTGAQKAIAVQAQPRKTSPPYTGDLSRFEDQDRAKKLQVEGVMDILGIKPGVPVADIGAGSGWFTVRAARRIGSAKVYAVDINPEFLQVAAGMETVLGDRKRSRGTESAVTHADRNFMLLKR